MAQILYLTQIQIDFGVLSTLAAECDKAHIQRPLIVTDPGVKAVGILQKAIDAMPGLPVAVFDQTPSNPTEAAVRAAVAVYHARHARGPTQNLRHHRGGVTQNHPRGVTADCRAHHCRYGQRGGAWRHRYRG
jgi:hypothetical protein